MRLPVLTTEPLRQMFVARREPETGTRTYGENIQIENAPVQESPQGAPDPIRQSMFAGMGRAPTEAWATVPVAIHLNMKPILSVMSDGFLTGKIVVGQSALLGNGMGGQNAYPDRQNIERGQSAPYGNRVQVGGRNQPAAFANGQAVDAHGIVYDGGRRRV